MALWNKKSRKRRTQPTSENTSTTTPQKQRKLFSPEVKLLAVKALEAGLTPEEVSEIVGAGNSSVTTWARAFREGGVESLVRKWLKRLQVITLFIEPGSHWENGYNESFNGKAW